MRGRYQFPEWVSLLSPHWMPDGRSIVVSGLSESGISDIYRVHLPDGTLEPLTADRYQDLDPTPGPDGRRIAFASDRAADGLEGAANLFLLNLDSARVTPLTAGPWKDESPDWAEDGRIYFTSDRDGVLNVSRWIPWAKGDGRPRPGAAPSTACRCRTAPACWWAASTTLSWNLYRYPVDTVARQERFSLAPPDTVGSWSWSPRATPPAA